MDKELEKYKARIRALENDLEEAEDDRRSAEKKLRKRTEELQALRDSLENDNPQTEATDSLQNELNAVKAERDEKERALAFVREVLTAPEVRDVRIDAFFARMHAFIKDQFVPFLVRMNDVEEYLSWEDGGTTKAHSLSLQNELIRSEALQRKTWLRGKRTVALVGEFSAGKTSIVNRILSQDNPDAPLLPVSTEATTAIPTYIVGSRAATTYQFVSPDDQLKEISEETFRRVNKRVLAEVKGVSSLIKNFVMSYKNPNLQGLSILDTPGFSSNDDEDSKRTLEVINECNALFWVFDVNNGTVNRNSLKLMREKLDKPLYVVINKVDTKAKSEVDKVEALVRKTMKEAGVKIEGVIRFSKKEPVQNILSPILNVRVEYEGDIIHSVLNLLYECNSVLENPSGNRRDRAIRHAAQEAHELLKKFAKLYNSRYR